MVKYINQNIVEKWRMDEKQKLLRTLEQEGITDPLVIDAIEKVPRRKFLPKAFATMCEHTDAPFSIGEGQTISSIWIVAKMTELLELEKTDKVLEIGTGSGYHAAVLAKLCNKVISIERIPKLHKKAKRVLENLGYDNVECVFGNGVNGYPEEAPYDKIICAAAYDEIPKAWLDQLKVGGTIVFPLRTGRSQVLISVEKEDEYYSITEHDYVVFVPLIDSVHK